MPLNQPAIPLESLGVRRLHEHLLATDPERFVVACRRAEGRDLIVGFAAAIRRAHVWFLSMLFVRPEDQGRGIGQALLNEVLPDDDAVVATATDTMQPISNALYAAHGIAPRMPMFALVGRPVRDDAFDDLDYLVADPAGDRGRDPRVDRDDVLDAESFVNLDDERIGSIIDELDRETLGFAHRADHAFAAREGRRGFVYRRRGSSTEEATPVAYGYTSEVGRVGPVAVRNTALLPAVLRHLLTTIEPRGASAILIPGAADRALVPLLRAGFRLEGFPTLVCWTRPFADFSRYLPISSGLL